MPARLLLALLCTVALLPFAPGPAAAEDAHGNLTPDEVADRFRACGYEVRAPVARSYQPEFVQSSEVLYVELAARDPGEVVPLEGRLLTIYVFPDRARVMIFHLDLHLGDERNGHRWEWSDDKGPALSPGLGMSFWRRNVMLAQSVGMVPPTRPDGSPTRPRFHDPPDQMRYAVDHDFVECLALS
jgi:hypothetical protein